MWLSYLQSFKSVNLNQGFPDISCDSCSHVLGKLQVDRQVDRMMGYLHL